MEKINETLKRLTGNENFRKRYEEQKRETLSHQEVQAFLRQHENELTPEMIEKGLIKLYEFSNQSKECNKCSSLEGCVNFMKGYHPELVIQRGNINMTDARAWLYMKKNVKMKNLFKVCMFQETFWKLRLIPFIQMVNGWKQRKKLLHLL